MKIKKGLLIMLISIIIIALSTNSYAVTKKKEAKTKKVENKISNNVSDEENNDETKNSVKNTTNKVKSENKITNTQNDTEKVVNKKETSKSDTSKKTSTREVISEDVVNTKADEAIEYENVRVNGNMFLTSSDKITLTNVKVDGDLILFANEAKITDSEVEGSIYSIAKIVEVSNSELNSVYIAGSEINVEEGTKISRELRLFCNDIVDINCKVGRDAYIVTKELTIGDDAKISGRTIVRAEKKSISDVSDISDLDYEKMNFSEHSVNINLSNGMNVISYLLQKGTEIAIILLIALFILYGFPKFSEVNASLRLRDFFKEFFTGLLEIIVIIAISFGLFFTVYGIGYGLILLNLLMIFVILGKIIFVISFAVRVSCNPEKNSKTKAFFATVLVSIILAVIEMISIAGIVGFVFDFVINILLAVTGFGSMFKVIFTSKKKLYEFSKRKIDGKNAESTINTTPIEVNEEKKEEILEDENIKSQLQDEVKAEIKEEINELKVEHEEETKIQDKEISDEPKDEDVKDEKKEEVNKSDKETKKENEEDK